jgi:hypothetical protein
VHSCPPCIARANAPGDELVHTRTHQECVPRQNAHVCGGGGCGAKARARGVLAAGPGRRGGGQPRNRAPPPVPATRARKTRGGAGVTGFHWARAGAGIPWRRDARDGGARLRRPRREGGGPGLGMTSALHCRLRGRGTRRNKWH